MTTGLSELARQIQYMRELVAGVFTAEFKAKLNNALDNINKFASDHMIDQLIGHINNVFMMLESENIIEHADTFILKMTELAENVDSKDVAEIIHNFNLILKQAVDENFLGKVGSMLDTVSSLKALEHFAMNLIASNPVKAFMLLSPFGHVLLEVVTQYREHQKDKIFADILKNMQVQLLVDINHTRDMAAVKIQLGAILRLMPNYDRIPQIEKDTYIAIDRVANDAMNNLPPLSIDALKYLNIRAHQLETFVKDLYKKELRQSLEDVLDGVISRKDIDYETWKNLVARTIYKNQQEINYNLQSLSYDAIRRSHGGSRLDELMATVAKEFENQGGNNLYYRLGIAITNDHATLNLENIAIKLPSSEIKEEEFAAMNEKDVGKGDAAKRLLNFYHSSTGAKALVEKEWHKFMRVNCNLIDFNDKEKDVIVLRAFLEYCKNTAEYLFFPHNIGREIINGATHVVNNISTFFNKKPPCKSIEGSTPIETTHFVSKGCRYI